MRVVLHRVDPSLPLPAYQTAGAAGFDVYARVTTTIEPKKIVLIPTNLIIATPADHMLLLAARSSLPLKKGSVLANGVGIIDSDYCGSDDEIKVQVMNMTDAPVTVERGERIAQGMFVNIERAEWSEEAPNEKNRGGFGSTGA